MSDKFEATFARLDQYAETLDQLGQKLARKLNEGETFSDERCAWINACATQLLWVFDFQRSRFADEMTEDERAKFDAGLSRMTAKVELIGACCLAGLDCEELS